MGPKAYSGPENLELTIQQIYCPLAQPAGPQCFSAFSFSAFASLMTLSAMKAGTSS